jgi:hypothetical protein
MSFFDMLSMHSRSLAWLGYQCESHYVHNSHFIDYPNLEKLMPSSQKQHGSIKFLVDACGPV